MGRPAALERGTEVRSRRAALKRSIRDGGVDAATVIGGRAAGYLEDVARDMPIGALLGAVPGIGPVTVAEMLSERGIPAEARTYALTHQLRRELADEIKGKVAR